MESLGFLAALGAATLWAISSLLTIGPVRQLGTIAFNAFRMLCVALMLSLYLAASGGLVFPTKHLIITLLLSGFVGIYLGDSFLFSSVKRLGPRLAGLLFATNAPISFIIGICWFNESHQFINFVGVVLATSGIMLALSFRTHAGAHQWEQSDGNVGFGIAAGLLGALCQSVGTFIALEAMHAGTNPILATTLRVWVAVSCLILTLIVTKGTAGFAVYRSMGLNTTLRIVISGLIGMGIGMSLLLWAIKVAPVGIVATLSATTPIMILPLAWILTKERPHTSSAWAALAVVVGVALVFLNA